MLSASASARKKVRSWLQDEAINTDADIFSPGPASAGRFFLRKSWRQSNRATWEQTQGISWEIMRWLWPLILGSLRPLPLPVRLAAWSGCSSG